MLVEHLGLRALRGWESGGEEEGGGLQRPEEHLASRLGHAFSNGQQSPGEERVGLVSEEKEASSGTQMPTCS